MPTARRFVPVYIFGQPIGKRPRRACPNTANFRTPDPQGLSNHHKPFECSQICLSGGSNASSPARICGDPFLSLKGTDSPAQGKPWTSLASPRRRPGYSAPPSLQNPEAGEIIQRRRQPRSAQIGSLYLSLSGIFVCGWPQPRVSPLPRWGSSGGFTLGWRISPFQGFRGSRSWYQVKFLQVRSSELKRNTPAQQRRR